MRKHAKAIGLMGLAGLAVVFWTIDPAVSSPSEELNGRKLFVDSRCQTCHSVSSAGLEAKTKSKSLKGPDLVNVAARHDADWIAKYVRQETQMEGKNHKLKFKGSDEELQALVDWLLEQKSE